MRKRLSNKQLASLSRQLSFALNSGLGLNAALVFLAGECKDKTASLFLQQFAEKIDAGKSPGESIWELPFRISPLFIEFILLGEQQGNMTAVMEQAAEHFERQDKLRNMLKTALVYPLLVLGFMVAALSVMVIFVLPSILQTYQNLQAEIPPLTAQLIASGIWLKNNGVLLGIGLFILLLLLIWQYPRWKYLTDKVPLYGKLYRRYFYIQFTQALGLLLNNGMLLKPSLQSLQIIFQQEIFLPQLIKLYEAVDCGDGFSKGIEHCYFIPKLAKQMLIVAAESGQLGSCLIKQQEYYQQELEEELLRMVKMLEPMLIVLLGVFIMFMASSLFLPLIQSYQYLW